MDDKSCFLFGHRNADEGLLPALELVIEELIRQEGVCRFYVGHYGGFDRAAAAALRRAKQRHPHITVMLVLPYLPTGADLLPQGFDGTYWPEGMESTPPALCHRPCQPAPCRSVRISGVPCGVGSWQFRAAAVLCPPPARPLPDPQSGPDMKTPPQGTSCGGRCYGTQKGQAKPVLFFRCRSRIV